LGAPTSNGISLIQSGILEIFWVITGTTSDHKLSKDVSLASQSSAIMGMHKLDEIISIYQNNRTDNLPIAIIQNGTKANEKKTVGTINSIMKLVAQHQLSSPAIIIIGEVVKHSFNLATFYREEFSNNDFIIQNLNITESLE